MVYEAKRVFSKLEMSYERRNAKLQPYADGPNVLGLLSTGNKYAKRINFDDVENDFILK